MVIEASKATIAASSDHASSLASKCDPADCQATKDATKSNDRIDASETPHGLTPSSMVYSSNSEPGILIGRSCSADNTLQIPELSDTTSISNANYRPLSVNESTCRMFGYSETQLTGQNLQMLFPNIWPMHSDGFKLHQNPHYHYSHHQYPDRQNHTPRQRRTSSPAPSIIPFSTSHISAFHSFTRFLRGKHKNGNQIWSEVTISELDRNLSRFVVPAAVESVSGSETIVHQQRYLLVTARGLASNELSTQYSRYETEFDELEVIGRGGYGTVYRVRNKIDGQEYAVKKIKLKSLNESLDFQGNLDQSMSSLMSFNDKWMSATDKRLIQEVKTFAQISTHPNVVRYYGAWAEPIPGGGSSTSSVNLSKDAGVGTDWEDNHDDTHSCSSVLSSKSSLSSIKAISEKSLAPVTPTAQQSPFKELFSPTNRGGFNQSFHNQFSPNFPEQIMEQQELLAKSPSTGKKKIGDLDFADIKQRRRKNISAILYIQMQYCPFSDLRRWLQERDKNRIDRDAIITIFRQIVAAVSHIHSKKVVHRDIKPENIFVQDGHIYLGDFGLARSIINKVIRPFESRRINSRQQSSELGAALDEGCTEEFLSSSSGGTGTFLYTSPEQNQSPKNFSAKSDIYALGIILIELFQPFQTSMERAVVLTEVRARSIIPQEMLEKFPAESELASSLISHDPRNRPTADDILQNPILFHSGRTSPTESGWSSQIQSSYSNTGSRRHSNENSESSDIESRRTSELSLPLFATPSKISITPLNPTLFPVTNTGSSDMNDQKRIRELEETVKVLRNQVECLQLQVSELKQRERQ